jgi:hypothetical protein
VQAAERYHAQRRLASHHLPADLKIVARLTPAQFMPASIGTQRIRTRICVRERNVAVGANQVRRILEVARYRGLLAPSEGLKSEAERMRTSTPERFSQSAKTSPVGPAPTTSTSALTSG